jgi:hypothetical protein
MKYNHITDGENKTNTESVDIIFMSLISTLPFFGAILKVYIAPVYLDLEH